jgi:transposase
MSKRATVVILSSEDRFTLERWVRSAKTEQRLAQRGRVILAAASGQSTTAIARAEGLRPASVSKWRVRFARVGLVGLQDAPRPGAVRRYGPATERRILAKLDEPPPSGHATWTGALVARALGEVSKHQVWRVLRTRGIHLQRRRSWCISTDPQFAAKAADIVGLYLDPPENAVVLSVDEKPYIQALERAQGYLKLPNGQAVTGFSHEYKRHGTTTLFAALEVLTGQVRGGHAQRRRRRDFLAFLNEVVALYPGKVLHVVLDNLNIHKPKHDRWRTRHPNVHFHFTPTHASWLNQIECWFSILTRRALRGASFTSPQEVREAIDRFVAAYNQQAVPFEWTKREIRNVHPKPYYANLRK